MSEALPHLESWIGRAKLAIARARAGRPGDFALLKADLLGAHAAPDAALKLAAVRGYRPKIDIDALATYPPDSFGRAYADWMLRRKLTPIEISDDLAKIADRNTFAVRYAATHDMFHVLTGFDTSFAGEIGVLAFAAAQGYAREQKIALILASLIYPVLSPLRWRDIFSAKRDGARMGRQASFLLGERLEDALDEDLNALRARLRLTPPEPPN